MGGFEVVANFGFTGDVEVMELRLRDYYDEVAKQPVPDRFMELLMQLEAKTEKKD